ncbi:MAG: hypothetical protein FD180_4058 [Planctomycetota bacterium]|nr:MAG: hypothetical protein FD180_4058 [Planctomycetota bacterium]
MKRELRRFADRAAEEQAAGGGEEPDRRFRREVEEAPALGDPLAGNVREQSRVRDFPGHEEQDEDAEEHPDIADAVGEERLLLRVGGGLLLEPEPDQQVAREADQLPEHVQREQVVAEDQPEHGEREDREIGEKSRVARVVRHVPDREDVNERRNERDDHEHDHRDVVDQHPHRNPERRSFRAAGMSAAEEGDPLDLVDLLELPVVYPEHPPEHHERDREPDGDRARRDPVAATRELAPEEDLHERREKRQAQHRQCGPGRFEQVVQVDRRRADQEMAGAPDVEAEPA